MRHHQARRYRGTVDGNLLEGRLATNAATGGGVEMTLQHRRVEGVGQTYCHHIARVHGLPGAIGTDVEQIRTGTD